MKKIDYDKINAESKRLKISPFLLLKRKLNYRKVVSPKRSCNVCIANTGIYNQKLRCDIIGIGTDIYSNIEKNYVCDNILLLKERKVK
jgi:hypothetical protein